MNENNYEAVKNDLKVDNIIEAKSYLETFGVTEKSVEIWGTGKPKREFLWSEDMADACVFIMENRDFKDTYSNDQKEIRNTHINIGTGKEISIKQLAETIKQTIGFKGELVFNSDKPDGTLRKLTDVSKLNSLGWRHSVELEDGIKKMYEWYVNK